MIEHYICKGPWPLIGGPEDLGTVCEICGQIGEYHGCDFEEVEDD